MQIARKPIAATAGGMIPVIVASWLLVGPAVRLLIPAYVGAVPAMRWSFLIAFVTCFQPLNGVFNVVRRQDLYGGALALGMAVNAGTLMWLIRDEVVLTAFPQAMLVGRIVFMLAGYLCLGWLMRRRREA